ncbi:putative G-Protein Coupled Receptor 179 [Manis pentadactyla]|nr:putative G-Protein Coupled Receptor 179 [Manis pentadactyla]
MNNKLSSLQGFLGVASRRGVCVKCGGRSVGPRPTTAMPPVSTACIAHRTLNYNEKSCCVAKLAVVS